MFFSSDDIWNSWQSAGKDYLSICLVLPVLACGLNPCWSGASSVHPLPEPPSCPLSVLMTLCLDQLSAAILKRKAALRALIIQCGLWWSNFLLYLFLFFGWIIFNACCFVHSITSALLFECILLTLSSHPVCVFIFYTVLTQHWINPHAPGERILQSLPSVLQSMATNTVGPALYGKHILLSSAAEI